jgi:Ca2+-binding EF-hand superfamily protein
MFFVGCSLSADIELLVSDPEEEAWQVWKPAEKYQARLPMTSDDEDTFPMGLSLDLNASEPVQVDDKPFPPAPIITCTTSEGLMISFAFIDTSVYEELEFVSKPMAFEAPITRTAAATTAAIAAPPAEQESAAQDDVLNVPAPEDSDESDLEEDREEERQNAIESFDALDVEQKGELDASKFPELIEKMGTTYCEEDHSKYAKRLSGSSGVIKKADFIEWYVIWVFGEEDEEDEEDNKNSATQPTSTAATTNLLAKFQMKEGSWRCDVCCVQNPDASAERCASCESPNPNHKGPAIGATPAAKPLSSFGFGAAEASSSKPSFSFGFAAPVSGSSEASTTQATSSAGTSFSFGFAPPSTGAGGTSSSSTVASSASSFSFGFAPPGGDSTKPATESAASSGFGFGFPSATTTASESVSAQAKTKAEPTKDVEAISKTTEAKPAETESYGQNDENKFASDDDDDDDDDEEERQEEEEKARNAFRAVLEDGETTLSLDRVPKLFKKMGSTYCEEEHDERMKKLAKDDRIHETDFAGWYVSWIFDDESSDEEEEDDSPSSSVEGKQMKSTDEIAAAFRKFQPTEGSWKCGICMVNNTSSATKCSACETPNPSAPKAATKPASSTPAVAPGVIGASGFSFPTTASSGTSKSNFSFGFPSSTPAATTSSDSKPVGGFSFAGGDSTKDKPATGGGFSFGFGSTPSGASTLAQSNPAAGGGFSFGFGAGSISTPSQPEPDKKLAATASTAAISGGYPPDTTTKPKPPAAFGGYPPDTTSKPKPPAAFGGYPPDTTTKPKPPAAFGGYPPDTTTKPKPPSALGGSGAYPPDTTTKPKPPPAFGGYPPDTTSKPKPPAAFGGGGYPPDTTTKPKPPSALGGGGYPPDTTTKPKPPIAFGGYPPDTTTKPKPPIAFGGGASGGAYPPDTTTKPKPPSALGGGYPPDTTTKPKPPAFGETASSGSAYPPDTTSKARLPAFGTPSSSLSGSSDKTKSAFSFSSFGSALQKNDSAPATPASGFSSAAAPSPFASKFGTSSLGTAPSSGTAAPSPFGVVPASSNAFFSDSPAAGFAAKDAKKPSFSLQSGGSSAFTSSPSSASTIKSSSTQRKLAFGPSDEGEKTERLAKPSTAAKSDDRVALPTSAFEGKLWTIISDFDKTLKRVNKSSLTIETKDEKVTAGFLKKLASLRGMLADLCDEINTLDASRDEIEKNVLFVIGRDGDVHEQLEYAREILASFDDKALKKSLEEQPLDDRSRETREALKEKFDEVEKCCADLENHLATSGKSNAQGVASSAHLFRVLKQTYENSKQQYNRVCLLADQVDKLSLRSEQVLPTKSVLGSSRVAKAAVSTVLSKEEAAEVLSNGEVRSQSVRKHFLALCNNSVTPRDVFKVERQKATSSAASSSSSSSAAPLRVKANSKLMPKAQMTIASPMSSAKASAGSISFKQTAVKSGSRLFSLAEEKTTKPPPTFTSTTQPAKPSAPVPTSNKRPNLSTPAPAAASAEKKAPSSAFSFPTASIPSASKTNGSSGTAPVFSGSKTAFSLDAKPTGPQSPFSLGGKEPAAKPTFATGWPAKTEKTEKITPTAAETSSKSTAPDYKALLSKFCEEHNATKLAQVDKIIKDFAGREKAMFQRLFTQYVPGSTDADVDKYLQGGPVPKKSAAASVLKPATPATATASPFTTATSKPATTPFGSVPTTAGTITTASEPTSSFGFKTFGNAVQATTVLPTTTPSKSLFGGSQIDYKQKLVEFYQKHNPSRLSTVDATLAKYKGNEAKLFQNLAIKYNVAVDALGNATNSQAQPPSTPVLQGIKANPSASPFGNTNAFAAINKPQQPSASPFGGGSSPGGFGTKPAAASPFGVATSQPAASGGFGTALGTSFGTSSGFGGGFGTSLQLGGPSGGFGAPNPRDRLVAFYQQHNPEKLGSVDATLAKYKGQEDRLFAMLEQKYLKKPAPAAGFGGIQTSNAFGGGFGAPPNLGAPSVAPAFGSASALGGPAPAFGTASTPGFGSASSLGGTSSFGTPAAFGAPAAVSTGGALTGGGFSSFNSQSTGFASFGGGNTAAGGGFGGAAASGGGGFGGFSGGAAGGFGQQPSTFSNPSFTQMR